MTETEEAYRLRARAELVKQYSTKGENNVTYVDFARIHNELRAAMIAWRFQNGES